MSNWYCDILILLQNRQEKLWIDVLFLVAVESVGLW